MHGERYYLGTRWRYRCEVSWHEGEYGGALDPRHDLRNHSPDGFEWGYGGSGPAQLALALLADALRDDEAALDLYQQFKASAFIGHGAPCWLLQRSQIQAWACDHGWTPPEERGIDLADPEIAG